MLSTFVYTWTISIYPGRYIKVYSYIILPFCIYSICNFSKFFAKNSTILLLLRPDLADQICEEFWNHFFLNLIYFGILKILYFPPKSPQFICHVAMHYEYFVSIKCLLKIEGCYKTCMFNKHLYIYICLNMFIGFDEFIIYKWNYHNSLIYTIQFINIF